MDKKIDAEYKEIRQSKQVDILKSRYKKNEVKKKE